MAFSSVNEDARYYGFSDINGFKDYVVYVYSYAPDLFPDEDWRKPGEQMNLDRAFVGLQYGLQVAARDHSVSPLLDRCRLLVEKSLSEYRAGNDHEGQIKLEELECLLKKLRP